MSSLSLLFSWNLRSEKKSEPEDITKCQVSSLSVALVLQLLTSPFNPVSHSTGFHTASAICHFPYLNLQYLAVSSSTCIFLGHQLVAGPVQIEGPGSSLSTEQPLVFRSSLWKVRLDAVQVTHLNSSNTNSSF